MKKWDNKWHLLSLNKIKLCQAVRKEKDIKCLHISVRKDYVKTDIRRRNRFLNETLIDQLTFLNTRSIFSKSDNMRNSYV